MEHTGKSTLNAETDKQAKRMISKKDSKYMYELQMGNTASNKQKCREELRKSESTEEDFLSRMQLSADGRDEIWLSLKYC